MLFSFLLDLRSMVCKTKMVRKSTKNEVYSGNTFRASSSRYNRRYHKESYIVRETVNLSRRQTTHETDCLVIDADGVSYSLNKKGRWALPNMIKENIEDFDDNEVKISIVERHKLNKAANCIEVNINRGHFRKVKPRKSTYLNDINVTGTRQEDSIKEPEIRYDVYYPSPSKSSISHNTKYIRNCRLEQFSDGLRNENGNMKKSNGKKHKRHGNLHLMSAYDSETEYSDEGDLGYCEDPDDAYEPMDTKQTRDSNFVVYEPFQFSINAKRPYGSERKKRSKKEKSKTKEPKSRSFVVPVDASSLEFEPFITKDTDSKPSLQTPVRETTILIPVRVVLPTESLKEDKLYDKFGSRYKEAECMPRTFIVDITDQIYEGIRRSKSFRTEIVSLFDMSGCIVFTRDAFYDEGLEVYRVMLNMITSQSNIKLITLFDMTKTTVDEIIQSAVQFIDTLQIEFFEKKILPAFGSSTQMSPSFNIVKMANKWKSDNYLPLQIVSDISTCLQTTENSEMCSAKSLDDEQKNPEFCNICFEEIDSSFISSFPATALKSCGHWFCNPCWHIHVVYKVLSGATDIKCPEYNCNRHVDMATLLSLVNLKEIRQLQYHRMNVRIQCSPNAKWCPNPFCGRVLEVSDQRGEHLRESSLSCPCGTNVCFKCMEKAHWPALCNHIPEYENRLKQFGDDKILTEVKVKRFLVRGKHCPRCKNFIEKNGGCKSMTCICGANFCWFCLKTIAFQDCGCYRRDETDNIKSIMIRHIDTPNFGPTKSELYKMAVENRNYRRPSAIRALKSASVSLGVKLKSLISKDVIIGQNILEIFGDPKRSSKDKMNDFLMSMVSFKLELNHVVEHTAVLLDSGEIKGRKLIKMQRVVKQLEMLSNSIQLVIYSDKNPQLLKLAIPTLDSIKDAAKSDVTTLAEMLTH